MSYQSFSFILFVAIVLFFYYLLGKKRQLYVLAVANLVFYAIAGVKYIPFIFITMIATFLTGKKIGAIYEEADKKLAMCNTPKEKKEVRTASKAEAKKVLHVALFVSIALLGVCKYTSFTIKNINVIFNLLNIEQLEIFNMILPLGISFYTFMALSYVLDIYWKRYKAESNFLMYAVYLSYFPHVVQGPIDRFNDFKKQIENGVALSYQNITYGAQLALWGFFKKLVIADRLGLFVNNILDTWQQAHGLILIAAIAVYSIQIYTDFSGCIDIVTGVSEMFGIQLKKNFNHPYFSKTMPEFWRRWHISLQEWFKDYVYYPVSTSDFMRKIKKSFKQKGNKKAEELFSSCFPILVVWMITGIWHGASWNFVVWGLYHATLLIGSHVLEPVFNKLNQIFHVDTENFGWYCFQMLRTYILCCIGRVFFVVTSVGQSFSILKKMVTNLSFGALMTSLHTYGSSLSEVIEGIFAMGKFDILIAIIAVGVLLIVDILQEKMKIRETLSRQNIIFRWIIIYIGLFAVILFGIYGPGFDATSFIYEKF